MTLLWAILQIVVNGCGTRITRWKERKKKKRGKMDGNVVEGISNLFKATTRKKMAKLWICCHCEHKVM